RDALSLLEQARAYCGDTIPDKEVRELLGVVPDDALEELIQAIARIGGPRAWARTHVPEGRAQPATLLPGSDPAHSQPADRADVRRRFGFDCGDAGPASGARESGGAFQRRRLHQIFSNSVADGGGLATQT